MLNEDANDNSQSANELIEQTKTIKNGKHQMNDSAMLSAKPVKEVTLKIYRGAPHGMCTTHKDQVNGDLLAFIKS